MKKSLIATAGVAAFAVAAVPAAVFATTGSTEFTDNLSVDVAAGCTMENSGNLDGQYVDRTLSKAIATGNHDVLVGSSATDQGNIVIKCNTTSGTVTIKAVAANGGNLKGTTDPTNNVIEPGAQITGDKSGWAIKSNDTNASTHPYNDYKAYAVDTSQTYSTFLTSTASANGTTFNPSYQVYVAQGQAPDTYTGSVTYTLHYTPGS